MSASLVRKGLEIVDTTTPTEYKKNKKKKEVFELVPENQKYIKKRRTKGGKVEKINVLSCQGKLTVTEARKHFKSKDEILKDNLRKLELIKKASKVDLDKDIISQIIERAVTKRPVKPRNKHKKEKKTAFTEEDFKKFEEEYFGN